MEENGGFNPIDYRNFCRSSLKNNVVGASHRNICSKSQENIPNIAVRCTFENPFFNNFYKYLGEIHHFKPIFTQKTTEMRLKTVLYCICLTFLGQLKAQTDTVKASPFNYEIGFNFAQYLHAEIGGNVFLKKSLKTTFRKHPIYRNLRLQFGYWEKNKPLQIKDYLLYDDTLFLNNQSLYFQQTGIERIFFINKHSLWYGADFGIFYKRNASNKRSIRYSDAQKNTVIEDISVNEALDEYGLMLSFMIGYRYSITKNLGVGTEFNSTYIASQRRGNLAVIAVPASQSYNSESVFNRVYVQPYNVPRILFLSWRF
jgi:hypothetical protein